MTLTVEDEGFEAIHNFYIRSNYPNRFNYQGYMWRTKDGTEFTRHQKLDVFSGKGNEDRPFRR